MVQMEIFRFLVDHTLEMIFLFDEHGRIEYINEAAKQGLSYEEEDLEHCTVSDIFPGEFWFTDQGFETNCRFDMEILQMVAYRKNKTCFDVEARIMKYDEEPTVYLCVAQNVSKQNFFEKKANQAGQEMEEALKVKSQFTANVTHELRTPVNGILGNTQELITLEKEPEKLRLLRLVERGCSDMHAIINNILDFSKLEAGKFTLELRKFHFRSMIDYVKSNHINKITEKGLDFFLTVSPDIPEYIIGDELRIVQILNNLLSNACKFTSVGRIALEVVRASQMGNRAELFFMVIDSGIGIDVADQDKLFKSFSQVEASTSRKYGGTGLGLNISKQLVELMDGDIRVESEKNKGTMFSFHIWVEIPQEELDAQSEQSSQPALQQMPSLSDVMGEENIWTYGEAENLDELRKKMSKLILSVEMDNWEKAEMFMDTVKQLTESAPREVKSATLRLKMAVQKADHDKTVQAFEKLQNAIEGENAAE